MYIGIQFSKFFSCMSRCHTQRSLHLLKDNLCMLTFQRWASNEVLVFVVYFYWYYSYIKQTIYLSPSAVPFAALSSLRITHGFHPVSGSPQHDFHSSLSISAGTSPHIYCMNIFHSTCCFFFFFTHILKFSIIICLCLWALPWHRFAWLRGGN